MSTPAATLEADGDAIPKGGDDGLQHLETIVAGGELPSSAPETSDALDALLKQAQGGEPEPTAEEKAAKEKADAADAAKVKADAEAEAARVKAAAEGTETDEAKKIREAAEKDAAAKAAAAAKETFADVKLPEYTKPKAAEAFTKVKTLAKIEIDAATERATTSEAKVKELEKKLADKPGLDPATEAELKELRAFRQKLDVEASPEFKEFDTRAKSNEESIFGKLKTAGFPDEMIAKIKEIGVGEVDWEPVFAKIPPQVRRYIEAKLVENEDLGEKKTAAITAAKANAAEYLKTRDPSQQGAALATATKAKVDEFAPSLDWLKDQQPTEKSTEDEKKAITAHNTFVKEIREDMAATVHDNSPETKAILIVGYAQLRRVRADFENFKADKAAEIEKLTGERDKAQNLLDRVKNKSTARLSGSAPEVKPGAETKKGVDLNEDTGSVLDRMRASVEAEREAQS